MGCRVARTAHAAEMALATSQAVWSPMQNIRSDITPFCVGILTARALSGAFYTSISLQAARWPVTSMCGPPGSPYICLMHGHGHNVARQQYDITMVTGRGMTKCDG
ncbi:hypothetical protein BDN71DRAFT_1431634 [Pleurotus eryngii]|uniref:Uncharacterized protein n=1 Tax=Pleurotus eryngii TaxID=5323 RepID=A0A9P5ZUI5_PLEER|nr:hypothetical protein BDN71DRAFT_1431634 [Pleurotus eryngii]